MSDTIDRRTYTMYVTDNVDAFDRSGELVACIWCVKVYHTSKCYFNTAENKRNLYCSECEMDQSLMVVKQTPLRDMSDSERIEQLAKWRTEGYGPL